MKRQTFSFLLILLVTLFLNACNDNDKEEIREALMASNARLVDLGQVNYEQDFKMERKDSVIRCEFKTKLIKKNDTIQEVRVWQMGKRLNLHVTSSPNDFDCTDDSCFTAHLVIFEIDKNLPTGTYNIDLGVNNGYNKESNFKYELN
ncbi:MAG: hypothetical protein E6772_07885 [Dysgonomonas sp.]|nr:hypothetical protein [Dysgonomonas sp.]